MRIQRSWAGAGLLAGLIVMASGCGGSISSSAVQTDEAVEGCAALTGGTVSASGNDGDLPSNVLDGNLGTRWSSEGKGQWIQLDLLSSRKLCGASVAWFLGNQRSNSFMLSVSVDGKTFSQVFSGTSSGKSVQLETYLFQATARYLRLIVNGNSQNDWASVTELRALSASAPADAGTPPADGGTRPVDAGTPPDAGVGTVTSLSKDGITWTFDHPVLSGHFITGDVWVVGPVSVTAVSPAPTSASPYLNGSVVNLPTSNGKSGFDSRLNDGTDESSWFDASLRARFPVSLEPGAALVSTISLPTIHSIPEIMRASDMNVSPVQTASVLTVLSAAPSPTAFRPSYCDRGQTLYDSATLKRSLLPSLAPPNPSQTPALATFEGYFRRPWIDTNAFLFDVPAAYMPSYGEHVSFVVSYASLLLTLNFPAEQKTNLTNFFVQYGIDLYGCVKAGYRWPAFGGHRSGRKLPILVAGLLLGNSAMENVSAAYPNSFGEDMQTVYVDQIPGGYTEAWQGAKVIYGGHYGVDQSSGKPVSSSPVYGPYEQLQPPAWPLLGSEQLGEAYRRCCTSVSWVGEALAARRLGLESAWNHPAFFDYVDRWMTEDDTQAVAQILALTHVDYSSSWERQRQTQDWLQGEFPQYTFIDDMWKAYR